MSYLHDNVFLTTVTAQTLYHDVAKHLPIIDFHTHLPEQEIANNHRFPDIWELWLKHDHYKWRLMRACGVPEKYITGNASGEQKFTAFASILPHAYGNPVHHWAHLELRRVFGIEQELNADSAAEIWQETKRQLQSQHSVCDLLKRFNVELVCTTDDPTSDLTTHQSLKRDGGSTAVLPTFRPDRAHQVQSPAEFAEWVKTLSQVSNQTISNITEFTQALHQRHDFFHQSGCRLSDHGLAHMPTLKGSEAEVNAIFLQTMGGATATPQETEMFTQYVLSSVLQWNHEKDWTTQLHLGPQRRVNSSMSKVVGSDAGFDTMGSWPQTAKLIEALDDYESAGILGRTIVYNLNPNESESICCALQNFQNEKAKGLIQYGPAWWHQDHVRGIREQFDILTNLGALGTSIGMLTDSRSFTSYVRHEYYRRLLCQYIGQQVDQGEMPNNLKTLKSMVANICYHTPQQYFNWSSH